MLSHRIKIIKKKKSTLLAKIKFVPVNKISSNFSNTHRQKGVWFTILSAFGVGPLSPVSSNETEEGRAKNRRVEIVKE